MTQTTIHGNQIPLFDRPTDAQVDAAVEAILEAASIETGFSRAALLGQPGPLMRAAAQREAREAGELKRLELEAKARRASKGAATSRAALALVPTDLELEVLAELERGGPGTAEELGDRLKVAAPSRSAWGPQTMSGACNRLLRKRRIYRARKRPGRSGRLAWVWEIRASDSLPADP